MACVSTKFYKWIEEIIYHNDIDDLFKVLLN